MKFVLSAGVISLAALCFGESNGNGIDDKRVAEIKTRQAVLSRQRLSLRTDEGGGVAGAYSVAAFARYF